MTHSSPSAPLPPQFSSACYPMLLVIASPIEARAVLAGLGAAETDPAALHWRAKAVSEGLDAVLTGVGKSNAAAAVALCLERRVYGSVVSIGIAGALPNGTDTLKLTDAVVATRCVYADEGVQTPDAFVDCAAMGFPLGPFDGRGIACDEELRARLRPLVDAQCAVATVSTCSGTDALAAGVQARTGAMAECMEGAAVAHVTASWSLANPSARIRAAELRVISNNTGDRDRQQWAMKPALLRLERLARDLRRHCGGAS